MDSFNKVLSFVLGLVVVVVFIAVASKRLNLNTKFLPFSSGAANKVTVIPTPSPVAKTGQKIQIKATRVPKFVAGKELKNKVR